MAKAKVFSQAFRERAIQLVRTSESDHPSRQSAINRVARKVGCSPETLRKWIRGAEKQAAQA
ncbi:MAG: transposase [Myxococcota bacterium]